MPETVELPQETPTRILVVDDDDAFRESVCAAIARDDGMVLAAQVGNAESARDAIANGEFDVALVDLGLPDGNGIDLIREIARTRPDVDVMVVTVFGDDSHVVSSFEAGAVGYLLKDTPADQIARCIVELHEGGSPISPSVARHLLRRFVGRGAGSVAPVVDNPLSEREREVLRLIEKGMTYEEVAELLQISWHTVTAYLRRVYRKLQVNSRTEAVYEARQRGIL